jgi:alpha-mannosidase
VAAAVPTAATGLSVGEDADGWVIDTGRLRVVLDRDGLMPSVIDLDARREVVAAGRAFGLLQLHNDRPSKYEAWDIDGHVNRMITHLGRADSVRLLAADAERVGFEVVRRVRDTTIIEQISFSAGSPAIDLDLDIDWHEQRTLLKLAFPTNLLTDRAASEIQFGHVFRPTYVNTSWDAARHETCAHRWVHIAESGFGLAVANDSTYGHDIGKDAAEGTGPRGTTVRLSLIRGPRFPDPETDQGRHRLRVSVVCGTEIAGAIVAGQRLNQPLRRLRGAAEVSPLVSVDAPGVLVETVKPAEDGTGDLVLRLYESWGGRTSGTLTPGFDYDAVAQTDLLERTIGTTALTSPDRSADGALQLCLRPFEIVTLRFSGVSP